MADDQKRPAAFGALVVTKTGRTFVLYRTDDGRYYWRFYDEKAKRESGMMAIFHDQETARRAVQGIDPIWEPLLDIFSIIGSSIRKPPTLQ